MRNILYICIMLLGIMCFVGCNDCHGNKKLLAQTDSLLQSRPDSALKLLNSIEKDVGFSEAEWMQFVWNCAQARYRMGHWRKIRCFLKRYTTIVSGKTLPVCLMATCLKPPIING